MKGFLLIDKEKGISSFDLVRQVKKNLNVRKVGHAGTLDPLASGLMILGVGEGTKLLEFFIGMGKEYEVVGNFGAVSNTYDAEGEIEGVDFEEKINKEQVGEIIQKHFIGEIDQIPPKFSALKVGGQRACDIVRKGGEVELKSRKVMIDSFEIIDFDWPLISFRVRCGSGTYIRSLIHDLGQKLGCGAYVKELRRNKVADFSVERAINIDSEAKLEKDLIPLEKIVEGFERWDLSDSELQKLSDGKIYKGKSIDDGIVMAFFQGELIGVLENHKLHQGIKFRKIIL